MNSQYLLGFLAGAGLVCWITFLGDRCRFRWHRWGLWTFDASGKTQYRICRKCNYNDVRVYQDTRNGIMLTRTVEHKDDEATRLM